MPARLVYSPKAYVFTKSGQGHILNITDYVTSGSVKRLVDQASSATVTLRNPNRRFTIPRSPAFVPMDGITIWLQRIDGHPVQVFTGYLDDTPYYQMYPGTITLNATCTLKRLMYTYFDPSLPSVNSFLSQFGWIIDGAGGAFASKGVTKNTIAQGKSGTLVDGGIAQLLYSVLTDIGEWDDTNIYIENLPNGDTGIAARMAALTASADATTAEARRNMTDFLTQALGSASSGSGGTGSSSSGSSGSGAGGSPANPGGWTRIGATIDPTAGQAPTYSDHGGMSFAELLQAGNNRGLHPTLTEVLGITPNDTYGMPMETPIYIRMPGAKTQFTIWKNDVGSGQNGDAHYKIDLHQGIANALGWSNNQDVEVQAASGHSTNPGSGSPGAAGRKGGAAQHGRSIGGPPNYPKHGPGGNPTTGGSQTNVPFFPLKPGTFVSSGSWSQDQGVDISTTGAACGQAAPLLAIADGTVTAHGLGGFGPDAPILQLNQPIQGYNFVYYGHAGPWGAVAIGTKVKAGQVIGSVGCGIVGISTGPHLEIGFATNSSGQPAGAQTSGAMLSTLKSAQAGQPVPGGGSGTSGSGSGSTPGGATANVLGQANAAAFSGVLTFPTVLDEATAVILGGQQKGLMHDQQLLPFVQQLTTSSMRHFQSLPNGDFFAFYPDYFGETGHRKPYWNIDDIEVLRGDIYLNDSSLVTHEFVVGNNYYPVTDDLMNDLFSSAQINIFNAFLVDGLISTTTTPTGTGGTSDIMNTQEALDFMKRYGARPKVDHYPQIHSSLFEMFMAYQNFMQAWAAQFRTIFNFTFMPELFPGGKVAFSGQGLAMYINSVTHTWDYVDGFTTDAELMAPIKWGSTDNPDLPPNMVQALSMAATTSPPTKTPTQHSTNHNKTHGSTKQTPGRVWKGVENWLQNW